MKKISQLSGMPKMHAAFLGWKRTMNCLILSQAVVDDGFPVDTETPIKLSMTIQPLSPEEIILKPDGQRDWEWLDIHVEGTAVPLKNYDIIFIEGIRYKVMSTKDYSDNNYKEFHIIRDYQDE